MKNTEIKQEIPAAPNKETQDVVNAIEHVNPDVVLRNLAFWLDIAIARGRFNDFKMRAEQDKQDNSDVVPTPDKDTE